MSVYILYVAFPIILLNQKYYLKIDKLNKFVITYIIVSGMTIRYKKTDYIYERKLEYIKTINIYLMVKIIIK